MKRFILSLVLVAFCGIFASADTYNYLAVTTSDKLPVGFALRTIRKIVFRGDNMILTTVKGEEPEIPLSTLQSLSFVADQPVGVQEVHTSVSRQPVLVYNMSGQIIRQFDGTAEQGKLNLNGLPRGVYIMKQGTETRKILKK